MGVIGFIVLILPSFSNSTQLWKQLISQCATQRVQLRFGKHGPHAIVPEYGCINSVDCIFRNGVDKSAPDLLWQEAEFERLEEHTSELQSLMRISYAVFCLKKKNYKSTVQIHVNASVPN